MEELRDSDYQKGKHHHQKHPLMQLPDDDQVFEITDFTTATDWERFIADFEEILRKWDKLELPEDNERPGKVCGSIGGGIGDCLNYSETVTLKFAKFILIVRLYCYKGQFPPFERQKVSGLKYASRSDEFKGFFGVEEDLEPDSDETQLNVFTDLMDFRYSFPHRVHCIYRWFGVKKFVVISPMENNLITSEDRAKLLLSSAAIAMRNINVYTPVFVQIHHPQRKFFHGILEGSTSRIMFDMIHFKEVPESFRYLSELTKMFREKVSSPFLSKVSIELSVRFTHILKEWPQEWIIPETESIEESNDLEERLYTLDRLPMTLIEYSSPPAPIEEIHVSTTWPKLAEDFINDSPNHSNLNSMEAPYWSVRALFQDRYTPALVHSMISLFILAKSSKQSDQPLGKYSGLQEDKAETEARAALDKLAGVGPPSLTLPQFRAAPTWTLSEDLKCRVIEYIFTSKCETNEPINGLLRDYRSFKSCPFNNLTWRLSIIFHQLKDLTTIAYLWTEIVKKLRDYWENLIDLPSLEIVPPDLSTSILNQKLQMLNCCIQQKRKREINIKIDSGRKLINRKVNDDDSDDEFFDAIEDEDEFNEGSGGGRSNEQPEGRSHQLNDLKLTSRDEPLYVPITQDPAPMTEDMMMEQVQILAQLGTSTEGAALRARMQSAQLISDMEAFKAANPGSHLEDFVRWHSPRDFIVDDDDDDQTSSVSSSTPRGKLSARMETPGNMWREVWESARSVPVARQKLLFDYTKEAEKILHSFASLTGNGLINYLAPCLIHSATSQLMKRVETLGYTESEIEMNLNDVTRLCSTGEYDKCLTILGNLETRLVKVETLRRLFRTAADLSSSSSTDLPEDEPVAETLTITPSTWNMLNPFILGLTQEKEMEVGGGSKGFLGKLLVRLFVESGRALYEERTTVGERTTKVYSKSDLPPPLAKEYVLRATCPRPSLTSKPLPQRMFALITSNEFRVSGAFCQDTLFR